MGPAPPLRIWLYSAALTICLLGLIGMPRHAPWLKRKDVIASHTQAFLGRPPAEGQLRILGLGSSLLWAATPKSTEDSHTPGIEWMRMTKSGTGMGSLQSSFPAITDNPPDVLVIEDNLLLPETGNPAIDLLREDGWLYIRQIGSSLSGGLLSSPIPAFQALYDQEHAFICPLALFKISEEQLSQHVNHQPNLYANASLDAKLLVTLNKLAQRGVSIVLLDLQRSTAMERLIAPQKQRWLARIQKQLPSSATVRHLRSPSYSQDQYCDAGHLNAAGARQFGTWWRTQMQQFSKVP